METSKAGASSGDLPAAGNDESSAGTSSAEHGTPFGPGVTGVHQASAGGKGATVELKCKVTVKDGAALFSGADLGGSRIGGPDSKDVILELESTVAFNGGAFGGGAFGGADFGGSKIGHPDEAGGDGAQRRPPSSQMYGVTQSEGDSGADNQGSGKNW